MRISFLYIRIIFLLTVSVRLLQLLDVVIIRILGNRHLGFILVFLGLIWISIITYVKRF
jgi:hypothetical protein